MSDIAVEELPTEQEPQRQTRTPPKTKRIAMKPQQGGSASVVYKVKISELKTYPVNPRVGDMKVIADSLKNHGQFRPIIVQKSTDFILAGNHTYKAAVSLGWKTIDVIYWDVDDNEAKKIVLIDNRTNDLSTYNSIDLSKLLKSMPDPHKGTGYSALDVQGIIAGIEENSSQMIEEIVRPIANRPKINEDDLEDEESIREDQQSRYEGREVANLARSWLSEEDSTQKRNEAIAKIQQDLMGSRDMIFPKDANYWGIPELLPKMLLDYIPDPIDTWAGYDATPDDGVSHYIWNFGLASSKNMPWDRAIMAGFTYDTKFDSLYDDPEWQFARLLYNGLRMAIVPDFSLWGDDPRFLQLQSVYRAQWVGRFMQEIGIKVMPRILWCDPESTKYAFMGIPKGAKVLSICYQSAEKKYYEDPLVAEGLRTNIRVLKPEALLVYSGNPGKKIVENARLPKDLHVVMVDNYSAKRRGVVFDKKEGAMGIKKPNKSDLDAAVTYSEPENESEFGASVDEDG